MGFLTVKGTLMTYSEYKNYTQQYKIQGLSQFLKIYKSHKDRNIKQADLHWGEEIEYSLFYFDLNESKVKLMNDALNLI
jgi:hypothetical protein